MQPAALAIKCFLSYKTVVGLWHTFLLAVVDDGVCSCISAKDLPLTSLTPMSVVMILQVHRASCPTKLHKQEERSRARKSGHKLLQVAPLLAPQKQAGLRPCCVALQHCCPAGICLNILPLHARQEDLIHFKCHALRVRFCLMANAQSLKILDLLCYCMYEAAKCQ